MSGCGSMVVIKSECTETKDIIVERPIEGSVKMHFQGDGITRSLLTVAGEIGGLTCSAFGKNCSGTAEIGTSETIYSGTPYKISTIRCAE